MAYSTIAVTPEDKADFVTNHLDGRSQIAAFHRLLKLKRTWDAPEEPTEEMLQAAMKKAVETGIVPRVAFHENYLENWDAMREILKAALQAD